MAIGALGDRRIPRARNGRRSGLRQQPRRGRDGHLLLNGGIDFSGCTPDPDTGFCCVEVEETVTTVKRDPILECTHKNEEKCHYTYVTQFEPTAEEVCQENFEKICQITFKQEAKEETVDKCYRPLIKTCNGQGEEICQTVFESSCTTRYIEKQPGKFVGDTKCEKQPVDICGAGCTTEEGPEECHDKTVVSLLDVPEEVCDLNPQKTCKLQTRLVPKLKPEHECTIIPREVCNLKFSNPAVVDQPLKTKWCQDPAPPTPGETYEESAAVAPPVYSRDGRSEAALPSPPQAPSSQGFSHQQPSNRNELNQDNQIAFSQQNVELSHEQCLQNQQCRQSLQNVELNHQQVGNQNVFNQNNQFSDVLDQESSNQISFSQQNQFNNKNGINPSGHVSIPLRDNVSNFNQRGNQLNPTHRQGVFVNNGNQRSFRRQERMASHDGGEVPVPIPAFEKMTAPKVEAEKSWALI